jgi:hypothetical protein
MRYLRLQKYRDTKEHFMARAEGFQELADYLDKLITPGGGFKFYEVTVSDTGPGIVSHFLRAREDFSPRPRSTKDLVGLVNDLLTKPLTSKRDFPGAGHGLPRALRAISRLRGFISLRTDGLWLYGCGSDSLAESGLKNVASTAQLGSVVGTHFNILLPLRIG